MPLRELARHISDIALVRHWSSYLFLRRLWSEVTDHSTRLEEGEGDLLFAIIHCGPILRDLAAGDNRQLLPSFWRCCSIAESLKGQQRPSAQARGEQ